MTTRRGPGQLPDPALVERRRRLSVASSDGAVIVELAIAIPIFLVLLAAIFDLGLGFHNSRQVQEATRSGARIGSAAGTDRLADFAALRSVSAALGDSGGQLQGASIYRSAPGSGGAIPAGCGLGAAGVSNICNTYSASELANLDPAQFSDASCAGSPDQLWCPVNRGHALAAGDYLGVAVWIDHEPLIGLLTSTQHVEKTAVFPIDVTDTEMAVLGPSPTPRPPLTVDSPTP